MMKRLVDAQLAAKQRQADRLQRELEVGSGLAGGREVCGGELKGRRRQGGGTGLHLGLPCLCRTQRACRD